MDKELEKSLLGENFNEDEITERQWKILEAAIDVFSEKGFDASRTSDIAKEAEVAEGTIFRYYKTKKDLLLGLMFPLLVKFFRPLILHSVEDILKKDKDKSLDALLTDILVDRVELINKNLPLIKTIVVEALYQPELLSPLQEKVMPQAIGFIEKLVTEKINSNEIKDIDPRFIARSIMSLVGGYVVLTKTYPDLFQKENEEEEIAKIVDLLLYGISSKEREECSK